MNFFNKKELPKPKALPDFPQVPEPQRQEHKQTINPEILEKLDLILQAIREHHFIMNDELERLRLKIQLMQIGEEEEKK